MTILIISFILPGLNITKRNFVGYYYPNVSLVIKLGSFVQLINYNAEFFGLHNFCLKKV